MLQEIRTKNIIIAKTQTNLLIFKFADCQFKFVFAYKTKRVSSVPEGGGEGLGDPLPPGAYN